MAKSFMDLVNEARQRITEVDVAGTVDALGDAEVAILDVREPEEFAQGHIQGAINIPRGVAEMGVPQRLPDRSQRIICYCGGGNRSALAADNLRQMGYERIESMAGGFRAWVQSGQKVAR